MCHHLLLNISFNIILINSISIPKKVINLYIPDTLNPELRNLNTDFSGYGIEFDSHSEFSIPDDSMEKNVIIFGTDMSSSVYIDNKGKDILVVGQGLTQGVDDTTLTAEALYPINFIQPIKVLH